MLKQFEENQQSNKIRDKTTTYPSKNRPIRDRVRPHVTSKDIVSQPTDAFLPPSTQRVFFRQSSAQSNPKNTAAVNVTMPTTEDAGVRPSTPEKRRRDGDFLFTTPTSGTDMELKLILLQQRHNEEDAAASEPSTPKSSADIEVAIAALKKRRDECFEDVCFILRKAGKKMDECKVQNEEADQEIARLLAEHAELLEANKLAEMESSDDQGDEVETVGTSSPIPETTSTPNNGDMQAKSPKKPAVQNSQGRKRKTRSASNQEGDEPKAQKKRVDWAD